MVGMGLRRRIAESQVSRPRSVVATLTHVGPTLAYAALGITFGGGDAEEPGPGPVTVGLTRDFPGGAARLHRRGWVMHEATLIPI